MLGKYKEFVIKKKLFFVMVLPFVSCLAIVDGWNRIAFQDILLGLLLGNGVGIILCFGAYKLEQRFKQWLGLSRWI
jgi:hypothetical protein